MFLKPFSERNLFQILMSSLLQKLGWNFLVPTETVAFEVFREKTNFTFRRVPRTLFPRPTFSLDKEISGPCTLSRACK